MYMYSTSSTVEKPASEFQVKHKEYTQIETECPVCLDLLLPPIYQCCNGHSLCKRCESTLFFCTVCPSKLSKEGKIRNLAFEKIVMCLIFTCENQEYGCFALLKYNEVEKHKLECEFRPLQICFNMGLRCDELHLESTFLQHLKTSHSLVGIDLNKNPVENPYNFHGSQWNIIQSSSIAELHQSVSISKLVDKMQPSWNQQLFKFMGHLFFLQTTYNHNENTFIWSVSTLRKKFESKTFAYRIKLLPNNSQANSLEWKGQVSDFEQEISSRNGNVDETAMKFKISLNYLKEICKSQTYYIQAKFNQFRKALFNMNRETNDDNLNWRIQVCIQENSMEDFSNENHWENTKVSVIIKTVLSYLKIQPPTIIFEEGSLRSKSENPHSSRRSRQRASPYERKG